MRAHLNERSTILLAILTVLILIILAACTGQNAAKPAAATLPNSAPKPNETNASEAPVIVSPAALKKPDAGSSTAPSAETSPCAGQPVCANLLVTQSGKPTRLGISDQGLQASALQKAPTEGTNWVIDTGTPSPDGKWVAYTSLGYETGGPLYLQNLETSEAVNLIEQVNAHKAAGQPDFPLDLAWDMIGWFPDSQRLMVGPSDLSFVVIIDRSTYAAQVIGFPGGGKGGRMFVTLAPDGSRFLFIGENETGQQTLNAYSLETGKIAALITQAYDQGVLSQPRFSPDNTTIAYIVQNGQPTSGLTYAMNLLGQEGGPKTLVEGNLAMTVPSWSPDGNSIAFTRNDAAPTLVIAENAPPPDPKGNIWIVSLKDGAQKQVTFVDGLARSPVWGKDGKTLAFVTHTGEVDLASVDQPGQIWQAAGPSDLPEFSNVFFVP